VQRYSCLKSPLVIPVSGLLNMRNVTASRLNEAQQPTLVPITVESKFHMCTSIDFSISMSGMAALEQLGRFLS
jgi:hypothetical protein